MKIHLCLYSNKTFSEVVPTTGYVLHSEGPELSYKNLLTLK